MCLMLSLPSSLREPACCSVCGQAGGKAALKALASRLISISKRLWTKRAKLSALATTLLLAACSQTIRGGGTEAACLAFSPIRYSRFDTEQTKLQIVGHNAAGEKLCGWRP